MRRPLRLFLTAALAACTIVACADTSFIRARAFPSMNVADGRSTSNVTAEVRDTNGRPVPDGTRIMFASTLGSFRESIVQTVGGTARATFVSGGTPGTAIVTVTALGAAANPTTFELELVGDRSLLDSAQEFIEVNAPGGLEFAGDTRIVAAFSHSGDVHVRYRDVEIRAEEIQIDVSTHEVRARNAHLKFGRNAQRFSVLYMKLNQRRGYGITEYMGRRFEGVVAHGPGIAFVSFDDEGNPYLAPEQMRLGFVEVRADGAVPAANPIGPSLFEFVDVSESPSSVRAKKAVIFPMKQIQFHKAELRVSGHRVMGMPLFQLNLSTTSTPFVTEELIGINDNQLAVNFPHYLTLKPGQTSMVRFRTGERYGRTIGSSQGAFIDYEMNWNRGDDMDGGFTLSGIARSDWQASLRQYYRFDPSTSAFVSVDSPAGRSVFGAASLSRQFDGFQVSLNSSMARTLTGPEYRSQDVSLVAEKDPTKVGNLPVRLFYGLTATSSSQRFADASHSISGVGFRVRAQSLPIAFDRSTTFSSGLTVSQIYGRSDRVGLAMVGSASLTRRLGNASALTATYDFIQDGFNDTLIGRHRLGLHGYYAAGRADLRGFFSQSLDADRMLFFGDASYRATDLWRIGSSYTYDRYFGSSNLDYNVFLAYRPTKDSFREIGLTWSNRTRRFGIQLFAAPF
jgi:hypothetical protein